MNKKLIALAVAGLFAAPAVAFAQSTTNVTIYGVMKMSVDQLSATGAGPDFAPGTTAIEQPNRGSVSNHSSRLGFKGSEDLGDGLSAVWQWELAVASDVSAAPTSRNTMVGLASKSMGTVLIGIWDTPYKTSTGAYDIFVDTVADYNAIFGTPGFNAATGASLAASASFDRRVNNVVAYVSPDFNGVVGKIGYVFGENPNATPIAPGGVDHQAKAVSLSANYDSGPVSLAFGYEKQTNLNGFGINTTAASDTDSGTGLKLGGSYSFGDTKVAMVWENLKADSNGVAAVITSAKRTAWMLNVAHKMGSNTLKASYSKANKWTLSCSALVLPAVCAAGIDGGATQLSLGLDHALSKRTKVYGVYTKIDNKFDAAAGSNRYTFASGSGVGLGTFGADPKAISAGIEHSF